MRRRGRGARRKLSSRFFGIRSSSGAADDSAARRPSKTATAGPRSAPLSGHAPALAPRAGADADERAAEAPAEALAIEVNGESIAEAHGPAAAGSRRKAGRQTETTDIS